LQPHFRRICRRARTHQKETTYAEVERIASEMVKNDKSLKTDDIVCPWMASTTNRARSQPLSSAKNDWAAFLGASYFRAIGELYQYGLSARGIAVNVALPGRPEEFPSFTHFYFETPKGGLERLSNLQTSPVNVTTKAVFPINSSEVG